MMFFTGDHAIDQVFLTDGGPGEYFDPSYGNPSAAKGYPTMADYEKSAIAGFAVIYRTVGNQPPQPLDYGADWKLDCTGKGVTCTFQAVPYAPPKP